MKGRKRWARGAIYVGRMGSHDGHKGSQRGHKWWRGLEGGREVMSAGERSHEVAE